jgi:hypothetical protein
MKPHRGTLILVFGILGLVCCVAFGIAAWVMGNADQAEMASGQMDPAGQGLTHAGKICGIISVALNVVAALVYGAILVAAMLLGPH